MASQDGGRGGDSLRTALHTAVDREQFDYAALVAGVHERAGRIRRRRAITTGVAVAVLGPALAGGAALVLPDILPGGDSTVIAPATRPDDTHDPATGPANDSATDPANDSATDPANDTATDTAEPTSEPTPDAAVAPWQDGTPVPPEGGFEVNEDLPNAWEIPDARPTGSTALDDLGAPQQAMNYPRLVPVMRLMVCDPEREGGAEPEAAQSFSFFTDDAGDPSIDIHVTGWEDSRAALDGLVNDTYTLCRWDGDPGEPQPWTGHEDDADHLLYVPTDDLAAAVMRQGDYLVAVTVSGGSGEEHAAVATEIAARTADNLAALDPVHGKD